MNTESKICEALRQHKFGFQPIDYDSYEEFELAIGYLNRLEHDGLIEIIDRRKESTSGFRRVAIVLVRMTDEGREWITTQS